MELAGQCDVADEDPGLGRSSRTHGCLAFRIDRHASHDARSRGGPYLAPHFLPDRGQPEATFEHFDTELNRLDRRIVPELKQLAQYWSLRCDE